MGVGKKATGQQSGGKQCVDRHADTCKRACNAMEKIYETRVRRQGKRECAEGVAQLR